MTLVAQNNVCDLGDGACFVCGSIDVVDRDGRGEATGGDVIQTDILSVDEKPGGTAVDERAGVALHRGVRRLNFNVDVERVVTWGRCDDEFLWQTTLPVSKPNSRCFWGRGNGLWHGFHHIEDAGSILTLSYYETSVPIVRRQRGRTNHPLCRTKSSSVTSRSTTVPSASLTALLLPLAIASRRARTVAKKSSISSVHMWRTLKRRGQSRIR